MPLFTVSTREQLRTAYVSHIVEADTKPDALEIFNTMVKNGFGSCYYKKAVIENVRPLVVINKEFSNYLK